MTFREEYRQLREHVRERHAKAPTLADFAQFTWEHCKNLPLREKMKLVEGVPSEPFKECTLEQLRAIAWGEDPERVMGKVWWNRVRKAFHETREQTRQD